MENKAQELIKQRDGVGSWGKIIQKRLDAVLKYGGKKVIDVGCSTGSYVYRLNKEGYDAHGCDLLEDNNWQGELRSKFKIADILNLPYDNDSFDTCLAFEVLEHMGEVDKAIKELHRVCKKNIIISVPNCEQPPVFKRSGLAFHPWIDPTHRQFFTAKTLKKKIEDHGLKIDHFEYINPIVPETLCLYSWYFPLKIASGLGALLSKLPLRRKFYMTMLVVASKK